MSGVLGLRLVHLDRPELGTMHRNIGPRRPLGTCGLGQGCVQGCSALLCALGLCTWCVLHHAMGSSWPDDLAVQHMLAPMSQPKCVS